MARDLTPTARVLSPVSTPCCPFHSIRSRSFASRQPARAPRTPIRARSRVRWPTIPLWCQTAHLSRICSRFLTNYYIPGSATANYFYGIYGVYGGSYLDILHALDRIPAQFGTAPGTCASLYACYTFHNASSFRSEVQNLRSPVAWGRPALYGALFLQAIDGSGHRAARQQHLALDFCNGQRPLCKRASSAAKSVRHSPASWILRSAIWLSARWHFERTSHRRGAST
jgi:hypothetical protein